MPENGFLSIRTYTSAAEIPIEGASVIVTQKTPEGTKLLASRITDQSGNISAIEIPAPDRSESLQAGTANPFSQVDITVDYPNYERILVENAQIFSGVTTQQNFQLIPIEERPEVWNLTEVFQITAQAL